MLEPPGRVQQFFRRVLRIKEPLKPHKSIDWGTYLLECLEKLNVQFGVEHDESRPSKVMMRVGLQHAEIRKLVLMFLMDVASDPANRRSRFTSEHVTREHVQLAQQFIEERLGTVMAEQEEMARGAYTLDMGRVLRGLNSTTACVREQSISRLALIAPQELRACQGKRHFDQERAEQLCAALEQAKDLEEFSRLNDKQRTAFERQDHNVRRAINRRTGQQGENFYQTVGNPKVAARKEAIRKKQDG
jgi:hypothetical protein